MQELGALSSLFAAVEAAGQVQRSVVRALDVRADGVVAGARPVRLPASLARPLLTVEVSGTALYAELADRCGVTLTGGQERVRAATPTRGERALLAVPDSVALLVLERTGCRQGRPIELRHTLVRGDRDAVTVRLDPRGCTHRPHP